MVLIFVFLANIRERHERYMWKCLTQIFEADAAIELKLRIITGDATPNPTIVIPGPKVSRLQRAIFYYADLVGTLIGITILIVVLVVWLCIGPVMAFNSNWWLLIGTYAGLIGLNDGFVLRNVQARLDDYQQAAFGEVILDDSNVFMETGIQPPVTEQVQNNSINFRLSVKLGAICAHEITVVLGVLLIIGLIVGSSLMKWTETGQLLSNIPPSIVESFFMMILITGHNILDSRRRVDLHNLYTRRLRVLAFIQMLDSRHI
ncbi:Low affinity iron permease-domain-containing protein [Diaporthe sp. PMI_573]|nr:Low affinity iron permease-domain-containing protein [Diaporthaceae sp. PMI_573]